MQELPTDSMLVLQRARSVQACPYMRGRRAAAGAASRHPTGLQRTLTRSSLHGSCSSENAVESQALYVTANPLIEYFCILRLFRALMPRPQRLRELLRARIEAATAAASMRERVGEGRDVMHGRGR